MTKMKRWTTIFAMGHLLRLWRRRSCLLTLPFSIPYLSVGGNGRRERSGCGSGSGSGGGSAVVVVAVVVWCGVVWCGVGWCGGRGADVV